jgi:parvulin-like peptidyl-prolyl isomerase
MIRRTLAGIAAAIVAAGACLAAQTPSSQPSSKPAAPASAPAKAPVKAPDTASPDHIQVQHILIGFQGSVPGKTITRTREESQKLAADVLARAKKGEDFGALVKEYTNDAFPGIYEMNNTGVAPAPGEFPRTKMVKGFGDVSFSLKVGEIGMASYDSQASPFGWHIVKRLK